MPLVNRTFDQLIDFTRTSAGTFVNSSGNIASTPQSVNLLTFTQEFDNAAWTKTNATVTANTAIAPDGTSTADTLVEDTTPASAHRVFQSITTVSTAYTASIYVKAGTRSWFYIRLTDSGNVQRYAYFNVGTGELGTVETNLAATITSVGSGWYRCTATVNAALAGSNPIIFATTDANGNPVYNGNGTGTILIWGAQLEQASSASTYTRNFGGLFPPRFDYDPVTRAPRGLLIEEQRTNFYTYSSDFTNAAWIKNLLNLTAGADIGPDGTTSATLIAANAGGNANIYGIYTGTGVQYTGSIWIKAGTSSTANIILFQNGIGAVPMTMTIISGPGTIGAVSSSNGPITGLSSTQWTRIAVTSTGALTGNVNFYVKPNSGSVSNLGDSVYIYGAQLEAGAFATSYIPTVASQVTRSADGALIQSPNFASWFNANAGTVLAEFTPSTVSGTRTVSALNDNTSNESIRIRTVSADPFFTVTDGGVDQANIDAGTVAAGTTYKIAGAYALNDFAVSINGAAAVTDTSGTLPTVTQLMLGNSAAANYLNGHLRSLRYYPARLSNTQLAALSA